MNEYDTDLMQGRQLLYVRELYFVTVTLLAAKRKESVQYKG